jgi:hypothetical protein
MTLAVYNAAGYSSCFNFFSTNFGWRFLKSSLLCLVLGRHVSWCGAGGVRWRHLLPVRPTPLLHQCGRLCHHWTAWGASEVQYSSHSGSIPISRNSTITSFWCSRYLIANPGEYLKYFWWKDFYSVADLSLNKSKSFFWLQFSSD